MTGLLALFRALVWRPWRDRPSRILLNLLGVALGVAVTLAIHLANHSALEAFRSGVRTVAGEARVVVTSAGGPFDERVFPDLVRVVGARGTLQPVLEGSMRLARHPDVDLSVLGLDLIGMGATRGYRLQETVRPDSLIGSEGIVLTEPLTRRLGIKAGDRLDVLVGETLRSLQVVGILASEQGGRQLDAHVALVDIATAQRLFRRYGTLDRIEVYPRQEANEDPLVSDLKAHMPTGLSVEPAGQRSQAFDRMIRSFQLNLAALGFIALLLGAYLIYNTVSISVVRRRPDIATLRALGVTRGQIFRSFTFEGLGIGLLGSLLGIVLGVVLAEGAVGAVGRTINALYVTTSPPTLALSPLVVLLSVGMGVAVTTVAALVPAWETAGVAPALGLRAGSLEAGQGRLASRVFGAGIAVLLAAAFLSRLGPVDGFPLFGFGAALALTLGASLLVPWLLKGIARGLEPVGSALGVIPRLAMGNLGAALGRNAVAIAALMVGVAMLVSMASMIGSFRQTVKVWTEQALRADLFVAPASHVNSDTSGMLSPTTLAAMARTPGVAAVDAYTEVPLFYHERAVRLGAGDLMVLARYGGLALAGNEPRARVLGDLVGQDRVLVSEAFSIHEGVNPGDRITLDTALGTRSFAVRALYHDYSSDQGIVVMDRSTFHRYFPRYVGATNASVYLSPGAEPEQVRKAIVGGVGSDVRLEIRTNRELRHEVLRIFDDTFAITWALQAIAFVVALLGVSSTLVALVLERQREFSVMRFLGFTIGQLRAVVVVEALLMGLVGALMGLGVGGMLAQLLVSVINRQSFGWTIPLIFDPRFLLQTVLLVVATAVVAGWYPAGVAGRIATAETARTE